MIRRELTDKYQSKYRHSKKYPIGIPNGENLYKSFKNSEKWESITEESRLSRHGDNRLDQFLGKNFVFKNVVTSEIVRITSSYSNTGNTVIWVFESECNEFIF